MVSFINYNESPRQVEISSFYELHSISGIFIMIWGVAMWDDPSLAIFLIVIGLILFTARKRIIIDDNEKTIIQMYALLKFITFSKKNFNLNDYNMVVCKELPIPTGGSYYIIELSGPTDTLSVDVTSITKIRERGKKLAEFLGMEYKDEL